MSWVACRIQGEPTGLVAPRQLEAADPELQLSDDPATTSSAQNLRLFITIPASWCAFLLRLVAGLVRSITGTCTGLNAYDAMEGGREAVCIRS